MSTACFQKAASKIVIEENGCLTWQGAKGGSGGAYGRAWNGERWVYIHRWFWEVYEGPIPPGMHLHHRCENPACVNLNHLMALTPAEHTATKRWKRLELTHCKNGHPYDEANTQYRRQPNGNLRKDCRACQRMRYQAKIAIKEAKKR